MINFVNKWIPRKIWQQIFLILVLLVVLPLIILGGLLTRASQKAVKVSVLRDHKELARHISHTVDTFIQSSQKALYVTSSVLGTLLDDPWRQETTLVHLALHYPVFGRIAFLSPEGEEMVTSELGTEKKQRGEEKAFQVAMTGERYLSAVRMSEEHLPVLTIAVPVKKFGLVKGVLIADLNLKGIWDMIDKIRIGQTGRACLLDDKGHLIAFMDKKKILKNENCFSPQNIDNILSGQGGTFEDVNPQGEPILVSFSQVKSMPWHIVIFQLRKESYAYWEKLKGYAIMLIFYGILAIVFISFLMSRWMSQPIKTLIEGMNNVTRKDFDYRVKTIRKDEFGRLFHSFNAMIAKLKAAQQMEKLSAIGKAATAIAHELKNSLVMINTYIGLLPEKHKNKKFIEEFSKIVPREMETWKHMLKNMTDYTKLYSFKMGSVDINALIEDIRPLIESRTRQKGLVFSIRLFKTLPVIRGNAEKLKNVLLNLINNAVDATPQGGTILLSTNRTKRKEVSDDLYVEVRVEDSGHGLLSKDREKIFEPFYTTKEEGLGLGLVVCKEIVEYHGGHIEVLSERGKGATFLVLLPVLRAPND